MRIFSITDKIVVTNLAISLAAVLIIGALSYYAAQKALWNRTFAQLQTVRVVKARQAENFFNDRFRETLLFLRSDELRYAADNDNKQTNQYMQLKNTVSNFLSGNIYINNVSIRIPSKKIQIGDTSLINYFNSAVKSKPAFPGLDNEYGVVLYDIYFKGPKLLIYGELNRNGRKIEIYTEIKYDYLNQIMVESTPESGLGRSGESYLVGKDMLMRSESRFKKHSVYIQKVNSEGVKKALEGNESADIYKDYRNITVFGSFGKIKIAGLDWIILAEIDLEEADRPIVETRNIIIFLTMILSVVVFIFSFILAKKLTEPIIALTKAAEEIGKGNLNTKAFVQTSDEIKVLADTFNEMIEKINVKEDELQKEKSERIRSAIDAQEKERENLARELHDGLGQLMSGLKLKLESADFDYPRQAETIIEDVKENLDYTIDEIRRISNGLMPAALQQFGLEIGIQFLCSGIGNYAAINFEFTSEGDFTEIDKKIQIYIYRIVQECLNNIVRHSKAEKVNVCICRETKQVTIDISDNGIGFDFDSAIEKGGKGLKNLTERAELLGGNVQFESKINTGTNIFIKIPII